MKNLVQNITSIWYIDIHHAFVPSRLRLFVLLFTCIASFGAVFAESGTCGYNLTWNLEYGVLTISGTGAMSDYEPLSLFDDQSNEAPWLYDRASITSIVIDEGVTSIGNNAFEWCRNLTSITIPNSVTSIGDGVFYHCDKLKSVTIGNSVKRIGNHAFEYCENLTSVTIPNSVTSIGDSVFYNCDKLKSVTIGNSVKSIGHWAFFGCSALTSVTIPNSVISIGNGAFEGCKKLTSVTMGNSVTSVGWNAFSDCTGLTSPVYNDHVFAYLPKNYSGAYTIPDGIETIADRAFEGCKKLTSVIIPNSVTSIESSAFSGCTGLKSVTIGNSVKSIGQWAFSSCKGLKSVTIPNSVTSIGYDAFSDCTGLTSVHISDIASWCSIKFDSNPLWYAHNLYMNGNVITKLVIPESVTRIESSAFLGCSCLTSVSISNSVINIDGWAFSDCKGLTSPVYNDHVFAYLPENYSGAYTIPDGIETIASGAFGGCKKLTSVTIPNSVTSIDSSAFSGCTGLKSVTMGNGVKNIGGSAFSGCSSLTSIDVSTNNSNFCSIDGVLFNKRKTILIRYPEGKHGSYRIPDGVTDIGYEAFSDCTGLTSIDFPNSIKCTYFTFPGCTSLTSITIQDIQFNKYTDESNYLTKTPEEGIFSDEKTYQGWSFSTKFIWPISGLPANKLHSMRQSILNAFASREVASALSAKVDDTNFHTALHNAIREEKLPLNEELTGLRYVPSSKVPKNSELSSLNFSMYLVGVQNGIYTFDFYGEVYHFGACHPYGGMWTLNYDAERNRPLALSDILLMDKEEEVNRIYRDVVNQYLRENVYGAGELDTDIDFDDLGGWYVCSDGIVFVFNPEDMRIWTCQADGIVEVILPISKYKHIFRPEALNYWANSVESSILLSSELDAANERISQIVQQHNEVINRSPYTQYLNKNERTRFMPTDSPFQIPKAYDYDQAKAFCDSLQRVANSLSQQDPMTAVTSIKDYLRATRPDDFVKAYFKENPTAKAHLESEHKEYRCHYASFTDFVIQYEQGRLQPSERNCRELKWQEYKPYYNNKKAFDADYDKGDEHLEAHKRHYELKWAEYKQYYSSREAFDADYHQGDATLEIHKKREIKWAECADYYEARYIFDFDYGKGETVVDAHRRRIDEAWSSLQQLPEELLVKKKLIGASESKKEDILNLFSLYRQLKPSPHFQSLAADFLISRNKKMSKEYEKNGAYFSSKIAFLTAYFSGDYKHIIKSMKK